MVIKTIESVDAAFEEWRIKRSSRAAAIPESLWSMALGLYPQYKRSTICHKLRLSGSQFKRRLEGSSYTGAESGFVLASNAPIKENFHPSTDVQLTIQGKERALTICVGVHTLGQILPHIGALL